MIIKSYLLENNINSINNKNIILFYGENDGLKDYFKKKIKEKNKDYEIINLFSEEIIKNEQILYKELNNLSLFVEKKLIIVNEANDKILEQMEYCLDLKSTDFKIVIFAPILEKRSKLRSLFEKSSSLNIVPCYADNERQLNSYISGELKSFKGLNTEIINLIINNSGMSRRVINNELEKIKVYFGEKSLQIDEIRLLLNIKQNSDLELIRDSIVSGNKKKTNDLLSSTNLIQEDIFYLVNLLNRRFEKMLELNLNIKQNNTLEEAIGKMKPPIFWKDKPIFTNQLKMWSLIKTQKILQKILNVEKKIKINSLIRADIVVKNLLVSICLEASIIS